MHFPFPYRIASDGRTASLDDESYVRGLIQQVLFTLPGERVRQPELGSPIHQLLFGNATEELTAALKALLQGALQQWLDGYLLVEGIDVRSEESTLEVTVAYRLRRTLEQKVVTLSQERS